MMIFRDLIDLFLDGGDDKIYIDVFDGDEFKQIFHDIRIINPDLFPYHNRKVIALGEGYDTFLIVVLGEEAQQIIHTAKWLSGKYTDDDFRYNTHSYKCSNCGCISYHTSQFCPDCGFIFER